MTKWPSFPTSFLDIEHHILSPRELLQLSLLIGWTHFLLPSPSSPFFFISISPTILTFGDTAGPQQMSPNWKCGWKGPSSGRNGREGPKLWR